ncbi:putative uncharacterized protein [Bacteroides sp. CAG:709]|nr:putative uncharacterized protein [Bacteroides sp. CAG:709]
MKRSIITILAAAAVLAGCKQTKVEENKGYFVLQSVTADANLNEVNVSTKAMPSELVDINTFVVKIESNLEGGGTQTYNYKDILDQAIELPTGSYRITAGSPAGKAAAWDQPLFEGTQNFTVVAGATSPVNVKCSLSNTMVSIKCTDTFKTELQEFNIKVSATDNDFLTWSKTGKESSDALAAELSKNGYFSASELYVQIDGKREIDGSTAALTYVVKNVHPKDHIILNLDARVTGQVQQITLAVDGTVNDRTENIVVGGFEEIPIPDPIDPTPDPNPNPNPDPNPDPSLPAKPSLVWEANPTFALTELKSEGMSVEITVNVPGKVKDFLIDVKSDCAEFEGVIKSMTGDGLTMDLVNNAALSSLNDLGIPTGDSVKGKETVPFTLSSLLPMILLYNPEVNSYHTFTLKVTDEAGQTLTQALQFQYRGN